MADLNELAPCVAKVSPAHLAGERAAVDPVEILRAEDDGGSRKLRSHGVERGQRRQREQPHGPAEHVRTLLSDPRDPACPCPTRCDIEVQLQTDAQKKWDSRFLRFRGAQVTHRYPIVRTRP